MNQKSVSALIQQFLNSASPDQRDPSAFVELLDLVHAIIFILDPEGRIRLMNQQGKELLEYGPELPPGIHLEQICYGKEQSARIREMLKAMHNDPDRNMADQEIALKSNSGKKRIVHVELRALALEDSGIAGIMITGSDVTNYKVSAREMEEQKDEAESLSLIKSEFLARVSHEIRTPLNAIMGFTEQLMQTELNAEQEEFLKIIDKSSEHLLSLINDVLVLSKIEAQQINVELQPFKLEYSIKMVYDSLRSRAEAKGLEFTYEIDDKLDVILLGDAFRLRQILINMLNNAIKFTRSGSVKLKCDQLTETEEKVQVRFDVSDTGIGIDPDKLELVFQQFRQADASITKRFGGTGLGLTICKNLIEMQRGSLTVKSKKGRGTTFSFTLPYKKGTASDIIPEDYGVTDSKKLKDVRVLLVDDDAVNRLLGKTLLDKFGCSYEIASNGEEAIQMLGDDSFQIVLLDLHMPDLDGFEVAGFIRENKDDRQTRIIAVTAAIMQADIQKFNELGIDDFIVKPFKEIHLFNRMCDVLSIETEPLTGSVEQIILKNYEEDKTYDLTELRKMADGDAEFARQMLITFIENAQQSILIFEKLLEQEAWHQIGETAHKLLPSFRHLQVVEVVSKLKEIKDHALTDKEYEQIPELLKSTIQEMNILIDRLKTEID